MESESVTLGNDLLVSPKKVDRVRPKIHLEFERGKLCPETQTQHLGFKNAFGLLRVEGAMEHRADDPSLA